MIDQKTIDNGETTKKRIPLLRYYRVFNVEQCELDPAKLKGQADTFVSHRWHSIESAEGIADAYLHASGLSERIQFGGNRAFYQPGTDSLQLPDRDRYENPAEFYSTLFHEIGHSTGHQTRLNRGIENGFGTEPYAREELVAEFTASFLCGESGIERETLDNSAAYLKGWLKALKNDNRLLVTAAAQAQKAADLILGNSFSEETEESECEA